MVVMTAVSWVVTSVLSGATWVDDWAGHLAVWSVERTDVRLVDGLVDLLAAWSAVRTASTVWPRAVQ